MIAIVGSTALIGCFLSFLCLIIGTFSTLKNQLGRKILVKYVLTGFLASLILMTISISVEEFSNSVGILLFIFATLAMICTIVGACKVGQINRPPSNTLRLNFTEIDHMDGHQFEYFVADILRRNGFSSVEVTKASGDYGVDIVAIRNGKKWAFQCKRYENTLGLKPIQEVYTGAAKYHASKAAVVTNSYFSQNAKTLAQELGVKLWDRTVLSGMILKPQSGYLIERNNILG